jgi:hypothetical protein
VVAFGTFPVGEAQTTDFKVCSADTLAEVDEEVDPVEGDGGVDREGWGGGGHFVELLYWGGIGDSSELLGDGIPRWTFQPDTIENEEVVAYCQLNVSRVYPVVR